MEQPLRRSDYGMYIARTVKVLKYNVVIFKLRFSVFVVPTVQ